MLVGACFGTASLQSQVGAKIPWTTYEAEDMRVSGTVLGPAYQPHRVETEASRQRCVELSHVGEYVEFDAVGSADALVLRYSLPDAANGGGLSSVVALLINGERVRDVALSSRNAWLYGTYPFSNDPSEGKPRNFCDEIQLKGLEIKPGDIIRLEKPSDDGVPCVIDFVDLEQIPAPVVRPSGSLSVLDFGASGAGEADDTEALRRCIAQAQVEGGVVWVPPGEYLITGDIVVPSSIRIQGAGMWLTTFVGDPDLYAQPDRRVRFRLTGADVHLADFAIFGQLNFRNDQEANDGVVGEDCTDASITRIWVEHTKAGAWIYNGTRVTIDGCRFRNLIADGVNLCVGTSHSVVQNCTARGTGDDCYAIWPVPSDQGYHEGDEKPGNNVIRRSTGQLTFLANGGSIYGGANNRIEDCLFTDISSGCGILISTTFPTADEARGVDNTFSGTTEVRNVDLIRCGGYDHSWAWRGALQLCLDRRSISGIRLTDVRIRDSFSDGITVVAPGRAKGQGTLTDTVLTDVIVGGIGLGTSNAAPLRIRSDAAGGLTLVESRLAKIDNASDSFVVVER